MAYTNPTVADFKNQFYRDFPYGDNPETSVLDLDITNAFMFVDANMNQGLFGSQGQFNLGYLLLAAHNLVLNLRASSQGINGQYNWLQNTKSVGAVSEGFSIPDRILANPDLAMLTKTNYGTQFLAMVLPQLCGQMFGAYGSAHAL